MCNRPQSSQLSVTPKLTHTVMCAGNVMFYLYQYI